MNEEKATKSKRAARSSERDPFGPPGDSGHELEWTVGSERGRGHLPEARQVKRGSSALLARLRRRAEVLELLSVLGILGGCLATYSAQGEEGGVEAEAAEATPLSSGNDSELVINGLLPEDGTTESQVLPAEAAGCTVRAELFVEEAEAAVWSQEQVLPLGDLEWRLSGIPFAGDGLLRLEVQSDTAHWRSCEDVPLTLRYGEVTSIWVPVCGEQEVVGESMGYRWFTEIGLTEDQDDYLMGFHAPSFVGVVEACSVSGAGATVVLDRVEESEGSRLVWPEAMGLVLDPADVCTFELLAYDTGVLRLQGGMEFAASSSATESELELMNVDPIAPGEVLFAPGSSEIALDVGEVVPFLDGGAWSGSVIYGLSYSGPGGAKGSIKLGRNGSQLEGRAPLSADKLYELDLSISSQSERLLTGKALVSRSVATTWWMPLLFQDSLGDKTLKVKVSSRRRSVSPR